MLAHPERGADVSKAPVAAAGQRVGRVAFAVKDDDACARRYGGWLEVIGGPARNAVVFEAGAPLGGPVGQPALAVQKVREIGLLVAKLPANGFKVRAEMLQHVGVRAQLEAVDGGVARDAPGALVVVDDEKFARLGKKLVQAADDDDVNIQKKGRAAQAVFVAQAAAEGGELGPAALGYARGQRQRRDGQALHFRADAAGVVREADEAEIALQMAARHAVEAVDVFGAVFPAPFHAQDVAGGLRRGGVGHGRRGAISPGGLSWPISAWAGLS